MASVYVHLFNNKWNTNFRSLWSGEFSARVRLWPITHFDGENDLVTPSEEALVPMLTGLCNAAMVELSGNFLHHFRVFPDSSHNGYVAHCHRY